MTEKLVRIISDAYIDKGSKFCEIVGWEMSMMKMNLVSPDETQKQTSRPRKNESPSWWSNYKA